MLKDFYVPCKYFAAFPPHVYDYEIATELLHPRWSVDETLQFAKGVDIKNKHAASAEMAGNAAKSFFPLGKPMQMVDRVEGAHDGVELSLDMEARHILPNKTDMRQSLFSDREHGPGAIESGDIVVFGKPAQQAAGTAGDFQNRFSLWMMPLDKTANVVRRRCPITHDSVVKLGKF